LFDYFPDNVCRNLVALYYRWVRPGGLLLVTNVHPNNPERYTMEHLLEWYLIYRDEPQMATLAPKGTDPEVYADETGVNVFMRIRKPG
jgi:extracellular factor (EF) 3-hydroxypalmitic acid methyl ester biosynthesis protein